MSLLQQIKDYIFWERVKLKSNDRVKKAALDRWRKEGEKIPPPHELKEEVIKQFNDRYSINTLVETGTFKGEMVFAQKDNFDKIYSIELSRMLYETAKKRLNKYSNVKLYCGDSKDILPEIVKEITQPAIFWLDGHYSGFETAKGDLATPINRETDIILGSKQNHILLIDDARLFTGENDYPEIQLLKDKLSSERPEYNFSIEHDIIRFYPDRL